MPGPEFVRSGAVNGTEQEFAPRDVRMDLREFADRLISAEDNRKPITPFTDAYPFFKDDQAYQAQRHVVARRLERGERIIGAKLGLTSKVVQRALNVQNPVYGWLTSGMIANSEQPLAWDQYIHPRIEPEIALEIGRELVAPTTTTAVLAATSSVFGVMEIMDSRFEDYRYKRQDVIADNVGAARVVFGPRTRRPEELDDLGLLGCAFRVQGEVIGTGAGAATMGHPAAAVAWLVNSLGAKGETLPAGSIVLTGGLAAPVPLRPGSVVSAEFYGLGSVTVYG